MLLINYHIDNKRISNMAYKLAMLIGFIGYICISKRKWGHVAPTPFQ